MKEFLKDTKRIKISAIVALITGILGYSIFMIDGYSCPDGLIEGLYYYTNANWALSGGRWATRYINIILGHNVVMPVFIVLIHCTFSAASTIILSHIFRFQKPISIGLVSCILTVNPAIIMFFLYPYIVMGYSLGILCSILFYYFGIKENKKRRFACLSVLCLSVALGIYQSHISVVATLIWMGILVDSLDKICFKAIFKKNFRLIILGILGCALDVLVYKTEMIIRKVVSEGRIREFSLHKIFDSFGPSIQKCYQSFFDFFNDSQLGRRYLYFVIFILLLAALIYCFVKTKQGKQNIGQRIAVFILCVITFPICMNIIQIITPYFNIYLLMKYQYIFIVPLLFSIIERIPSYSFFRVLSIIGYLTSAVLAYSYIISSNATFYSERISFRAVQTETQMILSDVYHLEGFVPNNTTIMFIGSPGSTSAKEHLPIFRYSIWNNDNPVYWNDSYISLSFGREQYLLNYCGIYGGFYSEQDFKKVVNSNSFQEMGIWPKKDSVRMINNFAVVKLTDDSSVYLDY